MIVKVELLQVLDDAQADGITVVPRHLFSVVFSLTIAGHSQHIDQVSRHC